MAETYGSLDWKIEPPHAAGDRVVAELRLDPTIRTTATRSWYG